MDEGRKHPAAHCEDCPLNGSNGQFVPSKIPEGGAKIAFIGESPGKNEVRKGEPFIGTSGQMLDAIMTHHGIERDDVMLTNATLCRLRGPKNEPPPQDAILACRPRLIEELKDNGVETAVAMGNSAAQALLGQTGITKLRVGPAKKSPHTNAEVICTLHPAATLRNPAAFPQLVADVGKIHAKASQWQDPVFTIAEDEEDALAYLLQLIDLEPKKLVIDIEVDIDKGTSFDHPNRYGMLCIGIAYAKGKALVIGEEACKSVAVREAMKRLFNNTFLIAWNGKFDLAGLYPVLGALTLGGDGMLAAYCFDEAAQGTYSLEYRAIEYLGAPNWKGVLERNIDPIRAGQYKGYGKYVPKVLYKYNAFDVCATWDLWEMYEAMFEEQPELRKVHDMLVRASDMLMYTELNGITIDQEYMRTLDKDFLVELEQIEEKLAGVVGEKVYDKKKGGLNPRSPQQVKAYFKDHDIEVDTTNEDMLNLIIDKYAERVGPDVVKFCQVLLEHRKAAKMHSTYVKGMAKRLYRGRVYPTFLLHGTTSGRLSCRNPNLQNIPRQAKMRRMFIPSKPDHVFVHGDLGQAELRILTWMAKDEYFRDIFVSGRDLFDELSPILYPEYSQSETDKAIWKELRIRVKAYVYGLSYGRSEFSIAKEFDIPVPEAAKGMHAFFEVIPQIVDFREQTRLRVLAGQDLVTPYGRHRRYSLITNENVKDIMNEALAFLPQSTASDLTLNAAVALRPELRGIGWIRNLIHDAILAECHKDDAEEVGEMIRSHLVASGQALMGDYVPIKVDITTGESWGSV